MLLTEIPNYIKCKKISNLKNISFNKVYTNSSYVTKSSVFIIEKKTQINYKKFVQPFINIDKAKINNNLYVQGNFENYNYFNKYRSELCRIFVPKKEIITSER